MIALWYMVHCYSFRRLLPRRSLSVSSRVEVKYMIFPLFCVRCVKWARRLCIALRPKIDTVIPYWFDDLQSKLICTSIEQSIGIGDARKFACFHLSRWPPFWPWMRRDLANRIGWMDQTLIDGGNYLNSHNHKSFIHWKSFKWQIRCQRNCCQQFNTHIVCINILVHLEHQVELHIPHLSMATIATRSARIN